MTIKDVAALIPDKFRKQILDDNVIYKAVAKGPDMQMRILVILYRNYINPGLPDIDMDNPCIRCLVDILDQFKSMEQYLVEIEREHNLIESV